MGISPPHTTQSGQNRMTNLVVKNVFKEFWEHKGHFALNHSDCLESACESIRFKAFNVVRKVFGSKEREDVVQSEFVSENFKLKVKKRRENLGCDNNKRLP